MSDRELNLEHYIEVEQKVIHLLLKSRSIIDEFLDDSLGPDHFEKVHQRIVRHIIREYIESNHRRLLTRDTYRQALSESDPKHLMHELTIYDKCFIKAFARPDDFGSLKKQLVNGFVGRRCFELLKIFRKDSKNKGYLYAAKNLVDELQNSLGTAEAAKTVFGNLLSLRDDFINQLDERRKNPELIIECGIPEIDSAMPSGFKPQHLTLFVGAPAGHKTNVMITVGLNLAERGHNVLFIPLEMPWDDVMRRILSCWTEIPGHLMSRPHELSDEQVEKIRTAIQWGKCGSHFCFLDASRRISISALRREIQKRISFYQPQVVIIDYADNILTESRYESRTIEIGEMLKALRFMGKEYNFHIVSAAQMNRSAIKAIREGNTDALDSTAIYGSHSYGADSDTAFGLMKVPGEPTRIKLVRIKCRHAAADIVSELRVIPEYNKVLSTMHTALQETDVEMESIINTPRSVIANSITELDSLPDVDFAGMQDEISTWA